MQYAVAAALSTDSPYSECKGCILVSSILYVYNISKCPFKVKVGGGFCSLYKLHEIACDWFVAIIREVRTSIQRGDDFLKQSYKYNEGYKK